jgi:hypothetical protein
MIPKYLETFRRATREAKRYDERNEVNEKRAKVTDLIRQIRLFRAPRPFTIP